MTNLWLVVILLATMGIAYQYGLGRSRHLATASGTRLHSLPSHYGLWAALWCGVPAFVVLLLWWAFEPGVIRSAIVSELPAEVVAAGPRDIGAAIQRIRQIASGFGVLGEPLAYEVAAAERLNRLELISTLALIGAVAAAAAAGFSFAQKRLSPRLRARNEIELVIRVLLLGCSAVAILTTLGIVLSMLTEAIRFFGFVSPIDFFFGTVWNPRFATVGSGTGSYGLLPLLWGTLLIMIIAMLVAVPLGVMSAVYMAEYARPALRAYAKPVIEILAGIPSVIYGVFALFTLGPLFHDLGAMIGLNINATSAFTAGVVIGLMVVPFVSSLSDDVITQVPRSMRDGSLGLGATKSETIRRVVLPAALPGIVGAILLAVSKAIGETMIVVMVAGNSPVLQPNPFQAVSTITVTIVNQLTGDTDFSSPQSLVGFALGITLFTMTLGLNLIALHIVRKYREQYE